MHNLTSNKTIQNNTNTKPLLDYIKEQAERTYEKMAEHANPTVSQPMNYDPETHRKFKKLKTIVQDLE